MSRPGTDPVREAARRYPARPAVVLPGLTLSWSGLDARVDAAAALLRSVGTEPGAIVAFRAPTDLPAILAIFAAIRLGAVAAPLGTRLPLQGLRSAETALGTPLRLDDATLEALADAPTPTRATGLRLTGGISRPATAVFTSGSTGEPRAALHTLAAHRASALGANAALGFGEGSRWLLALPLHHVGGLAVLFRAAFSGGSVALAGAGEDPFDALRRTGSSHGSLVATQLVRALQAGRDPGPGAKCLLLGGGPLPPEAVAEALRRGWPVAASYGLTESASLVTATRPGEPAAATTAGRTLGGRRLRIRSDGRILVAGRTLASAWLAGGRQEPLRGRDGWFVTGDLGAWDEEGRLVVAGRVDAMFVSGGENVHPEAIERVLLGVPGVRQAIVVPVADAEYGARPAAFVDGEVDPAVLHDAVRDRLPSFMAPVAWYPLDAAAAGGLKPSRRALEREAARRRPGP